MKFMMYYHLQNYLLEKVQQWLPNVLSWEHQAYICNTLSAGTLEDQEKKGILTTFSSSNGLIKKSRDILTQS